MAMPDHMPLPCRPAVYADEAQGRDAAMARGGLAALLAVIGLAAVVLILGLLARTGPLAREDLRVDEHVATHDHTAALT